MGTKMGFESGSVCLIPEFWRPSIFRPWPPPSRELLVQVWSSQPPSSS
ncbi:hypothetical protein M8C21_006504 [Ambrosia artemisiifolia]|uniref:Uncharacterized protein n=1 Tax=Ambrosia artemisiifolia TaxID=4212 RepID=A0AAD5GFU2_AMBAR|nr:hypothetical protein M8C21_006504 [Ambrosia artemisiifolia]